MRKVLSLVFSSVSSLSVFLSFPASFLPFFCLLSPRSAGLVPSSSCRLQPSPFNSPRFLLHPGPSLNLRSPSATPSLTASCPSSFLHLLSAFLIYPHAHYPETELRLCSRPRLPARLGPGPGPSWPPPAPPCHCQWLRTARQHQSLLSRRRLRGGSRRRRCLRDGSLRRRASLMGGSMRGT